jgi:hypothetical protein
MFLSLGDIGGGPFAEIWRAPTRRPSGAAPARRFILTSQFNSLKVRLRPPRRSPSLRPHLVGRG